MNCFPQAFQLFGKSAEHITLNFIHIHVHVYVHVCIYDFASHVILKNN